MTDGRRRYADPVNVRERSSRISAEFGYRRETGRAVAAAAGGLKYCRDCGAGLPDDAAEWHAMILFLLDFGQSFDWVFRGDAVSMIITMADRSRRGEEFWVGKTDSVFPAIERERAAYADYLATNAMQSQVEDQNPSHYRKARSTGA
jgi:hypothetical protein